MKLKYDKPLSNFAFNVKLRPHTKAEGLTESHEIRTLALARFGSVNCNYAGECELGEWD